MRAISWAISFSAAMAVSFLTCNKSYAWGENGHRIVAQIAESRLTPAAKKRVAEILGLESLAEASNWADEVRSDNNYNKYDTWHYVDISNGSGYGNSQKNPQGDVIVGIHTTIEALKGKNSVFTQKEALRYLIHFVGDIHQPLHVGNDKDKGGNLCAVKFAGKNTNLHVVWDTHLIEARGLSYTEFANFLNRSDIITPAKIRVWAAGDAVDWANESSKIRESVYPPNVDRTDEKSEAATSNEYTYCKKTDTDRIPAAQTPMLSYQYEYKFKLVLDEQLEKAGVRLAYVLNDLFR